MGKEEVKERNSCDDTNKKQIKGKPQS